LGKTIKIYWGVNLYGASGNYIFLINIYVYFIKKFVVTHYVYKTLLEGNDKYYIGRHSTTKKDILNDGYFGSGVWIRKIKDKNKLSKIILGIYSSIEDLYIAEELWIEKHYSDVNCMNMIFFQWV
jgi:hypothetical protein